MSQFSDIHNNMAIAVLMASADTTATTSTDYVDMALWSSVEFIFLCAGATGGDGSSHYFTLTLQESTTTTGTDFSTVAAADMLGTMAITADTAAYTERVQYVGGERYVRMTITETGTISAAVCTVLAICHGHAHPPVDDDDVTSATAA